MSEFMRIPRLSERFQPKIGVRDVLATLKPDIVHCGDIAGYRLPRHDLSSYYSVLSEKKKIYLTSCIRINKLHVNSLNRGRELVE